MTTNTFAYNGFGARVSKSDSSGSNSYLRASSGLIGSIVSDSGATYTPGVSEKRGTTSTFYHADIKNSVEQTSTSSQSVVASKQYDAFGNEVSSSGPWQGPFQYGGAFGYHTDSDYGLKHLGARYYDSTTGRFLSRDPIKDGRNWFVYCDGNPLGRIDPTGLWRAIVGGILGGIAGGILGGPAGAAAGAALGAMLGDAADQAAANPDGSIDWRRAAGAGAAAAVGGYIGGKLAGWAGRRVGPWLSGVLGKLLGRSGGRAVPQAAGELAEARIYWPEPTKSRAIPPPAVNQAGEVVRAPHTVLKSKIPSRGGEPYRQGYLYEEGALKGRVDVTDHGRPWDHTNPHYHDWLGPNGGWGGARPLPWE
jgi:RHS repeat-associated protein